MRSLALEPELPSTPLGRDDAATVGSDFSKSCLFDLFMSKPNKTIDIGQDGLSLSLDALGRVLQASIYHSKFGIVMANSFEQFDGSRFYDVSYVRAYRTRMLQCLQEDRPGFGLDFAISARHVSIEIVETNVALYHIHLANNIDLTTAVRLAKDGTFVQHVTATNGSPDGAILPYVWGINVSLNRASYGQLTEGGPVALPASCNILCKDGQSTLRVCNPNLATQLITRLDINGHPFDLPLVQGQEVYNAPLVASIQGQIRIPSGASATLCASFRLLPHTKQYVYPTQPALLQSDLIHHDAKPRWKQNNLLTTYVLRRNVEYILANCVVPVSESAAVIITDHVALPLGWNRDNYWQIRLLLETHANIADLVYPCSVHFYENKIRLAARGHLRWVYTQAERPGGFWHRSYLTNGQPKDRSIFQLDQQCYPLLELCDYLDYFPQEVDFVKTILGTGVVQEILTMLSSRQNPNTLLWPTDETPGDDAVVYPHHFSSHVLLWRTFTRLYELFQRLQLSTSDAVQHLGEVAAQLKERTIQSFKSPHLKHTGDLFAYLTDGYGNVIFYHDGNDIPTALAHEWGFVSTSEEISIWKATMEFALSPANTAGYCNESPYGGLGSVHSPGAWVLGYFQELAYAASIDNVCAMQDAWAKITAAMQWDGTFPEAVDPRTAKCTSRTWFSWPGAMIGALLIRMKKNGQEISLLQNKDR